MSEHKDSSYRGRPGPVPADRRRRLAIRVAVIICLAAPVACIGAACYPFLSLWQAQQAAVDEIERHGGEVLGPAWAPKYVSLPNASDSDICQLAGPLQELRSLHKVTISGAAVTKNGVKCLKPVPRLAVLDLRDTAITSDDIVEIRHALRGVEVWGPDLKSN